MTKTGEVWSGGESVPRLFTAAGGDSLATEQLDSLVSYGNPPKGLLFSELGATVFAAVHKAIGDEETLKSFNLG